MAKTVRDKFDLLTLCMKIVPDGSGGWKNAIIGTEIQMEDGSWEEIVNWWIDPKTSEIHLTFKNNSGASFDLGEKFFVKIESTYKSDTSKKKNKKHKKK